jgi:hypothetical protein
VQPFRKAQGANGRAAVKIMRAFHETVSREIDNVFEASTKPTQMILSELRTGTKNGVASQFKTEPLSKLYQSAQGLYMKYADDVAEAGRILNTDGSEGLVNKIVSNAGKNETAKGMTESLIELAGDGSDQQFKKILIKEAATDFYRLAPKLNFTTFGAGLLSMKALPAAMLASSPRTVARSVGMANRILPRVAQGTRAVKDPVVHYSLEALNAFNKIKGPQMAAVLQRPDLLEKFFQTPLDAAAGEQQGVQQLLEQGGVIPPQGQQR